MSLELWLAFVLASTVVLMIPGPTIILVVSYALSEGRGSAWRTVPGVALGDALAITASLLGLGALLATSATLFTIVKIIGAVYLIWLGIRLWRAPADLRTDTPDNRGRRGRGLLVHAFVVTALNPKSIAFFVAFVPQFMVAEAALAPQAAILGTTFVVLATVNAALYAILAGSARSLVRRPVVLKAINRVGGSFLIGAGLMTAAMRRAD